MKWIWILAFIGPIFFTSLSFGNSCDDFLNSPDLLHPRSTYMEMVRNLNSANEALCRGSEYDSLQSWERTLEKSCSATKTRGYLHLAKSSYAACELKQVLITLKNGNNTGFNNLEDLKSFFEQQMLAEGLHSSALGLSKKELDQIFSDSIEGWNQNQSRFAIINISQNIDLARDRVNVAPEIGDRNALINRSGDHVHALEELTDISHNKEQVRTACTPVDFSHKMPGEKVRDQRGASWCVHHALADFISFYTGDNVSPTSIAYTYNEEHVKRLGIPGYNMFHRGTETEKALNDVFTHGYCTVNQLPSVNQLYQASRQKRAGFTNASLQNIHRQIRFKGTGEDLASAISEMVSNDGNDNNNNALTETIGSLQTSFINANRQCRQKRNLPNIKITPTRDRRAFTTTQVDAIDRSLTSGHPVMVDYNSDILKAGSAYKNGLDKTGARHLSIIVGRKFNETTGECDYILRNSWGLDNCTQGRTNSYAKNYPCDEQGNVYVRKRDLLYSAETVYEVENYQSTPIDSAPSGPLVEPAQN